MSILVFSPRRNNFSDREGIFTDQQSNNLFIGESGKGCIFWGLIDQNSKLGPRPVWEIPDSPLLLYVNFYATLKVWIR